MNRTAVIIVAVAALSLCAVVVSGQGGMWGEGGGFGGRGGQPGGWGSRGGGGGRQGQPGMGRMGRPDGTGGPMIMSPAMAVMPPPAALVDKSADALKLTDDQKKQLKDLLTKGSKADGALIKKAANASKVLHSAVFASNYDAVKVSKLATGAEGAETAVLNANLSTWTQVRSILSSDQIAKLQKAMTARRPGPAMAASGEGPGM